MLPLSTLGPRFATAVMAEAPTPTPSPTPVAPPPELVTPGFGGFIIIAFLVVAVIVLVWDMQRRIRRARYRQEIGEQLDAEEAAARQAEEAVEASAVDDQSIDAAGSDDTVRRRDDEGSAGGGPARGES